jgi:glycosyltransferase involved in cell wall biosynthesis
MHEEQSLPRVGIVIPTYNRRHLVAQAIASALGQTFAGEVRIVVVDDGSTDDTVAHLIRLYRSEIARVEDRLSGRRQTFAGRRITIIRQENMHISAARNTGLRQLYDMGCQFLTPIDSDDLALPNKLADLVAYLKSHPEVGLVHSRNLTVSLDGALLRSPVGGSDVWGPDTEYENHGVRDREWPDATRGSIWERARQQRFRKGDLQKINYISNQGVMYTRWALEKVGLDAPYRIDLKKGGEDWKLHIDLEDADVNIGFCDAYVALYRQHPSWRSYHPSRDLHELTEDILKERDLRRQCNLLYLARQMFPQQRWEEIVPVDHLSVRLLENALRSESLGSWNAAFYHACLLHMVSNAAEHLKLKERFRRRLLSELCTARDRQLEAADTRRAYGKALEVYALAPSSSTAAVLAAIQLPAPDSSNSR